MVKILEQDGYNVTRTSGSHVRMKAPGREPVTVPVHHGKDLATGTLLGILKAAEITHEEYAEML